MSRQVEKAVKRWQDMLGADGVLSGDAVPARYTSDVSGVSRDIPAVLMPGSTAEVQEVVRIANDCKVPLYPISRGCNWGMGSRLPVCDGTVVVDLQRMNRIHEINVKQHYAVVEAGVSQGELYERITGDRLPLVLNVTGASAQASLIGNALERGVGYFAGRADELSGLEVVLGNGDLLYTGCGHFEGARTTYINRHGLGPSLDGLFGQSNYGIVTRAGVNLIPQGPAHMCMVCAIEDDARLPDLVEALGRLRRLGVLQTAVHIANRERSRISVCPVLYEYLLKERDIEPAQAARLAMEWFENEGFGAWSAVGGVIGTRGQLHEARRTIRRAVRDLGKVIFLNDPLVAGAKKVLHALRGISWCSRKEAMLLAAEPFYGLSKGVPSDAALGSIYWPVEQTGRDGRGDPNDEACGLMYCLPMIPLDGRIAADVAALATDTFAEQGMTAYTTLNIVSAKALESVINLAFDRRDEEASARAAKAIDNLHERLMEQGLIPYRTSIRMMDRITDENDTFWQTVRDLKKVLDPNGIIAPGRYNLV